MQIEVSNIGNTALVEVTTAYRLIHGTTGPDVVEWLRAKIHDDDSIEQMEVRDLLVEALALENLQAADELAMRVALNAIEATMTMSLWDAADLHCMFAVANDWPDDYSWTPAKDTPKKPTQHNLAGVRGELQKGRPLIPFDPGCVASNLSGAEI